MKPCSIKSENRSRRFWVMMILLLMGINLGVAAIAIKMAVGDVSIRPMPDYGEQAVTWQERIDALNQSKALGWTCHLSKSSEPASVAVDLCDSHGEDIAGCTGYVRAFHFTAAGQIQVAQIEPSATGSYRFAIELAKPGLWQIAMKIQTPKGEIYVSDDTWFLNSDGLLKREKPIR